MRKKKNENGLKHLNNLLRQQYKLQVKMINTMVGVSENTWNAWVSNVRVPQEEKKELFVKTFDKAADNPYNFGGKSKEEIVGDIKEYYIKESSKDSVFLEEKIAGISQLDKLLYYILDDYRENIEVKFNAL